VECPFCQLKEYVCENKLAFAIYDKYPVNEGHMLIITKRHVDVFFNTTKEEKKAIMDLLEKCKNILDKKFNPDGYNIGVNCGEEAGQTIMHLHVHIIPRFKGDIADPTGGVRGVIPEKRVYRG